MTRQTRHRRHYRTETTNYHPLRRINANNPAPGQTGVRGEHCDLPEMYEWLPVCRPLAFQSQPFHGVFELLFGRSETLPMCYRVNSTAKCIQPEE